MSIIEKIKSIEDLGRLKGCSDVKIQEAESRLGMLLPKEYKEYVKEFGCIDFGPTEWTGLNVNGILNTVEATLYEKEVNPDFPERHFVIEDLNIDARKVIVNEAGQVFTIQYNNIEMICDSLSDYLEICIARDL